MNTDVKLHHAETLGAWKIGFIPFLLMFPLHFMDS